MPFPKPYLYQWQNPDLLKTIYPLREKKLREFLMIYQEIDLMQQIGAAPVNQAIALELLIEHTRIQTELDQARQSKAQAEQGLKDLNKRSGELLRQRDVVELRQKINNIKIKFADLEFQKRTLERRVDWYRQFAPEHPYYDKYTNDLQALMTPYNQVKADLDAVQAAYDARLSVFKEEAARLEAQKVDSTIKISLLLDSQKKLPGKPGMSVVDKAAEVKWLILKYESELKKHDQERLLATILKRFRDQPNRFPRWLQYMIIHFSGMRYRSAHGSWASPHDLLEALVIDEAGEEVDALEKSGQLKTASLAAAAELEKQKSNSSDKNLIRNLDVQIMALKGPFPKSTLEKQHTAQKLSQITDLPEPQVIEQLKARKGKLPPWAWKEVANRVPELRLEIEDENWETLTPEERKALWDGENDRWRQILYSWETKDITAWRAEHERTLGLIVSRAVCNEIAEHIQHLRGTVKYAAGLTTKPDWYIKRRNDDKTGVSYFKKPTLAGDFKEGSSILWLGWVDRKPNPWQIAKRLPDPTIEFPPTSGCPPVTQQYSGGSRRDVNWSYQKGGEFTRNSRPEVQRKIQKAGGKVNTKWVKGELVTQWLRWTHEATVVDVQKMAAGTFVLTFETHAAGLGLNLRPFGWVANSWDTFVGYVPKTAEPPNLDSMLDPVKILPMKNVLTIEVDLWAPMPSEGAKGFPPPRPVEDRVGNLQKTLERWENLTRREKQIVRLVAKGFSTREIATRLDTSTGNVNTHVSHAMQKLGIHNRNGLRRLLEDWHL